MKKFISMVMTAAMVASLVPATAFAKAGNNNGDVYATAKVVDAWTKHQTDTNKGVIDNSRQNAPELQLEVTKADYSNTNIALPQAEFKVNLDGAEFNVTAADLEDNVRVVRKDGSNKGDITTDAPDTKEYNYTKVEKAAVKDELLDAFYETGKAPAKYYAVELATVGTPQDNETDGLYSSDVSALLKGGLTAPTSKSAEEVLQAWVVDNATDKGWEKLGIADNTEGAKFTRWENKEVVAGGNTQFIRVLTGAGIDKGKAKEYYTYDELQAAYKAAKGAEAAETKENKATWLQNASTEYDTLTTSGAAKDATVLFATRTEKVTGGVGANQAVKVEVLSVNKGEARIQITGRLFKDDIISVDLLSELDNESRSAYVSVRSSDIKISNETEDFAYVSIADKGLKATTKKLVKISADEKANLYEGGIVVEPTVDHSYVAGDTIELRLNKGFTFKNQDIYVNSVKATEVNNEESIKDGEVVFVDDDMIRIVLNSDMLSDANAHNEELVIQTLVNGRFEGLEVEVDDNIKSGTKGVITVRAYNGHGKNKTNIDKTDVEVIEVVDYKVVMSVDKDKTVPVYYNTVNDNDEGLTTREDHETLDITLEETFPGAWSSRKGFKITVPDGVYVTDVQVKNSSEFTKNGSGNQAGDAFGTEDWYRAFQDAYRNGDHKNFEFKKRIFDDVDTTLKDKVASMTFVLTLVADYEFEGDVKIGFEGDGVDKQEVVAAKFEKPYTVESKQNDLKIDARQTKLDSTIVTKEAKEGLWDKNTEFKYNIEKGHIQFEDNATFKADEDSKMEIKDDFKPHDGKQDAAISFKVKEVGSDKPAVVTISDMALYMERNIPQGAYALEIDGTLRANYMAQPLFAPDSEEDGDKIVDDVSDSSKVVNKDFINVITARRDEDGFTTRIAVPVGETFIFAGVDKLEGAANSMEVPAYINKDNYTMLPLRAVARALGIANGNIYWSQATQTATVQYGNSRIMTFKLGAKEMIINGHSMPAVAGIEMTNNRLFLSLRDLGVAMNVPAEKIAWDAKTKTAYLNPTEEDMAAIKG